MGPLPSGVPSAVPAPGLLPCPRLGARTGTGARTSAVNFTRSTELAVKKIPILYLEQPWLLFLFGCIACFLVLLLA